MAVWSAIGDTIILQDHPCKTEYTIQDFTNIFETDYLKIPKM